MYNIRNYLDVVKSLYRENDYPSDRLIRERRALVGFTAELSARAQQQFPVEEVAAELERIRKDKSRTGGLPKVGRSFHGPRFVVEDAN